MLLNLILAESALELVPRELVKRPVVANDARRRGKQASEILLDRSYHHSAMLKLKDSEKRGRPDLVHVALLAITGTPLYLEGKVKVFVHTHADIVVELEKATRIPKNYSRFRGLVEQVMIGRPKEGLLTIHEWSMEELLDHLKPELVVGLTILGRMTDPRVLGERLGSGTNPCVVVGGFSHGHFTPETLKRLEDLARIDAKPLEAHVVIARLLYEIERAEGRFKD